MCENLLPRELNTKHSVAFKFSKWGRNKSKGDICRTIFQYFFDGLVSIDKNEENRVHNECSNSRTIMHKVSNVQREIRNINRYHVLCVHNMRRIQKAVKTIEFAYPKKIENKDDAIILTCDESES